MTIATELSAQPVDGPASLQRTREDAVFRNRFGTLFNDDVVAPSGAAGQYLRWQWNQEGAVIVPVGPAGYALVPAYSYPVHAASLEFPRGGVEDDEELAPAAHRLLHPDFVALVDIAAAQSARPEAMESAGEPVWIAPEELPRWLAEARITCGVTLAALALVQSQHVQGDCA